MMRPYSLPKDVDSLDFQIERKLGMRRFNMKAHLLPALLVFCIFPSIASAQTAEEIIERNIAARGGAEKLRAIHSMRVTTAEEANWGGRGSSVLRIMRPDRMRYDFTWQGAPRAPIIMTTNAFDGQAGWWADQHKGLRTPHAVTGEALEELREEAQKQFAESLGELQANGSKVEVLGKDAVAGKPCYKIRFTSHTGNVRFAYYDAESFLIVRTEQVVLMKNKKQELIATTIGDYRSVNGILFPHSFRAESWLVSAFASAEGLPLPMAFFERKKNFTTSLVQTIEINPDMDESLFATPGANTVEPMKR